MSDQALSQGNTFKRILVGADEDGRSNAGVEVALDLVRRFDARCELVHAVRVPPSLWPKMDAVRLAALNAETLTGAWRGQRARLGAFLESLGGNPHDADDLLQVLPGSPAAVILQRITDWQADLVVLGPHRRRGLIDFGSTARAVLAETRVPIWVQPCPVRQIEAILAPVDQSDDSLVALECAASLAAAFGATLKIVHCFVPPDFAYPASVDSPIPSPAYVVDEIRSSARLEFDRHIDARSLEAKHAGLEYERLFVEGADPADRILALADQADLIVMATHGRTGLSAAVLGNVTYSVLKASEIPVLAIRSRERDWQV